jgi:hypothetical protein
MANARRGSASPPPEPPEPELRLPRSEVEAALDKQIEEGRRLLEWPVGSDGDYQSLNDEHSVWTGFNSELLGRMFTTSYYKVLYGRQQTYSSRINPTFRDREKLLKETFIREQVSRLNTIRYRLSLIPEAGGAREQPSITNSSAYSESTTEVRRFRIAAAHSGLVAPLVPEHAFHVFTANQR